MLIVWAILYVCHCDAVLVNSENLCFRGPYYIKNLIPCVQSALSISAQSISCASCPGGFLLERQTSPASGTKSSFYTRHQTDMRKGTLLSDKLFHGLSKATACQCLDLLYALVWPRISFIYDFRGAFWRQKLFSQLVALNAGLLSLCRILHSF